MISNLEKEITLRFLKARKNDGFLNVISIFSFIGISLGVAVLIIVMSVMNGFRTELINKIVGFNSHLTIKSYDQLIDKSKIESNDLKLISQYALFSNSGEAIILKNETSKGIVLRGYQSDDFSKLETDNQINKHLICVIENFLSKTQFCLLCQNLIKILEFCKVLYCVF